MFKCSSLCRARAFFLGMAALSAAVCWFVVHTLNNMNESHIWLELAFLFSGLAAVASLDIFALSFFGMRVEDDRYCLEQERWLYRYYRAAYKILYGFGQCFEAVCVEFGWAMTSCVPSEWGGRQSWCNMIFLLIPFAFAQVVAVTMVGAVGFGFYAVFAGMVDYNFILQMIQENWRVIVPLFIWLAGFFALTGALQNVRRKWAKKLVAIVGYTWMVGPLILLMGAAAVTTVMSSGLLVLISAVAKIVGAIVLIVAGIVAFCGIVYAAFRYLPALRETSIGQLFDKFRMCPTFEACER